MDHTHTFRLELKDGQMLHATLLKEALKIKPDLNIKRDLRSISILPRGLVLPAGIKFIKPEGWALMFGYVPVIPLWLGGGKATQRGDPIVSAYTIMAVKDDGGKSWDYSPEGYAERIERGEGVMITLVVNGKIQRAGLPLVESVSREVVGNMIVNMNVFEVAGYG